MLELVTTSRAVNVCPRYSHRNAAGNVPRELACCDSFFILVGSVGKKLIYACLLTSSTRCTRFLSRYSSGAFFSFFVHNSHCFTPLNIKPLLVLTCKLAKAEKYAF